MPAGREQRACPSGSSAAGIIKLGRSQVDFKYQNGDLKNDEHRDAVRIKRPCNGF
jgi:hypothetical protein